MTGTLRPLLSVQGLSRGFGDVVANDLIDFDIDAGEVVGLLGENGAGKSTFLSILSGLTSPDGGELRIDGRQVRLRRPADAIAAGIGTVFQHFALVPVFTVRDQLRLAGVDGEQVSRLLPGIDPDQLIGALSPGEQQRVELARVLAASPRILLLDEPTSTLTSDQVEWLFGTIRTLRGQGVGIVFITHKLPEVLAVADRIVVLRRGRVVDRVARRLTPEREWEGEIENRLLLAMFGEAASTATPTGRDELAVAGLAGRETSPAGAVADRPPLLIVERASVIGGHGRHRPTDVSFSLGPGETLAIVGIDGQGQRELAELLVGHLAMRGRLRLSGQDVSGLGAAARQRVGFGYLTDDRTGEGAVGELTVAENLLLKRQRSAAFQRVGLLRLARVDRDAREQIARWGLVPPWREARMATLSGGNIQKVLLAREMERDPSVLVASNPAQGLDLRTQQLVWSALRRVTGRGGAVVLLTPDISEALAHADRVAVLSAGRLSPPVPVTDTDPTDLSRLMVSGW